ncbi:hypothetical protein HB364_16395 [Pseudoflavitalea sp. X16]|uniref:hypothetical protein n=1 Tax=Paraflavitalea devenefica TaxID=2716334 RepID=UPI001420FE2E|nr:hypothetical protein [Paraflavitalea devenefica]NII26670.1 hypothetical protein [Paraflavitalea devenefica]
MKGFLIAGLVVLSAAMPVRMLGKDIDKGKLEKARDYVNGKITYLFLEAYVERDKSKKGEFESIKSDLQIEHVSSAKDATVLKKVLTGKFTRTIGQLVDPINGIDISMLTDLENEKAAGKIVDDAFAILSESYKKEYDFLQEKRDFLIMAIVNFLGQTGDPGNEKQNGRGSEGNKKDTVFVMPQKAGFFSNDHLSIWIVLLFLAITGAFVYCMREIKFLHEKLRKLAIDNDTAAFNKMAASGKETWHKNSTGTLSIRDVENAVLNSTAVQSLVDDVNVIKSMLEKKDSSGVVTSAPVQSTAGTREGSKEEVFYMAGPVNHYFPLSAKSATRENTVYKFTIKSNKYEAIYELHTSGAPVHEILSMVESYIRPACDEENLPGDTVRNIVTKTKGVAFLEGDRWMIKTKAIIRYE